MPSSLHKILIHGDEIIKSAALPIGMFSEEALESRNKDFKIYREFNRRKMSREITMRDLLNTLLYTSDPGISTISSNTSNNERNIECIPSEVRNLLLKVSVPEENEQVPESGSESE